MYRSFSGSLPCAIVDHFILSDNWFSRHISFVALWLNVFLFFFVLTGLCSDRVEILEKYILDKR